MSGPKTHVDSIERWNVFILKASGASGGLIDMVQGGLAGLRNDGQIPISIENSTANLASDMLRILKKMNGKTSQGLKCAIGLALVLFSNFPAYGQEANVQAKHLVTEKSVGFIKFGMTMGEVRKILPKGLKFGPVYGEENSVGVGIFEGETLLLEIGYWAGTEHLEPKDFPPIDDDQKISEIDIYDPRYHTPEGVRVGMKISEAEKKYGQFKEMFWLTGLGEAGGFTKQPECITFVFEAAETEEKAGIYEGGRKEESQMRAVKYTKGAVISLIRIYSPQP